MTGLNLETSVILEIASIVTTPDLKVIAEGPSLVISQPASILEAMDEWNTEHHTKSGLIAEVLESVVSLEEAEAVTFDFIQRHVKIHTSPLCGNSVWQDRRFLVRFMPTIDHYLHYRIIDVSTIKELARRWKPELKIDENKKEGSHRAMDDIRESINELQWYRDEFFDVSSSK